MPDGIGRGFRADAGRIALRLQAVPFVQGELVVAIGANLQFEVIAGTVGVLAAMVRHPVGQMTGELVHGGDEFAVLEIHAGADAGQGQPQRCQGDVAFMQARPVAVRPDLASRARVIDRDPRTDAQP